MFNLMQVFTSCDGRDFERYAESLLASIDINSPGQKVVLHVFDPGQAFEHRLDTIRKRLRSTYLDVLTESSGVSGGALEDEAGSYITRRFRALADYFRASRLDTLFLDIDSLVLRDLYAFPNAFPKADLAVHCPMGCDLERAEVRTGVIWLRANAVTRRFLKRAAGKMHGEHATLLDVLTGMPQLRIQLLSPRFVNAKDAEQGLIWSAKSEDNFANQKYQAKASAILNEFHASKTIAILSLRVDLGGRAGFSTRTETARKRLRNPVHLHWQYFPKIVRDVLNEERCRAEIISKPLWEIDQAYIRRLPHDVIFVPHRNRRQVKDPRAVFYMQELYPFFFTVDVNGWAASSSLYGSTDYREIGATLRAEAFVDKAKSQKWTKHPQSDANYSDFDVFFPLQVPNDEALRFHSDHRLKDIVHAVIDWAERYQRKVLFKRHPQNLDIDYLELGQRKLRSCRFVVKGDVHDLLDQARVVFVANSGVGFEALLHFKPLVVFARAVYDVVAFRGTLNADAIEGVYQEALVQTGLRERYLKFIEWYLFDVGLMLNRPRVDVNLPLVKRADLKNRYREEIAGLLQVDEPKYISFGTRGFSAPLVGALHSLLRWPGERLRRGLALVLPEVLSAEYFRDKRVALVSDGKSILQEAMGDEIDSHDVVVRTHLNPPLGLRKDEKLAEGAREKWLAGSFEDSSVKPTAIREVLRIDTPREIKERHTNIRHLGEKSTVWLFSTTNWHSQRFFSEQFLYTLRVWMRPSVLHLHFRLWHRSKRLSSRSRAHLRKRLSIRPSSGLVFFELLRRADVASLNLYGFDFASNGSIVLNTGAVYSDNAAAAEFEYVHGQIAANPRFELHGFRYNHIPIRYHAGRRVALLGFSERAAERFCTLFRDSKVVRQLARAEHADLDSLENLDVFVWGRLDRESEQRISSRGLNVTRVSDGLVENSWCFDKAGLYKDPAAHSELLYMLRNLEITPELAKLSDTVFYALGYPAEPAGPLRANRVLVIAEKGDEENQLAALAEKENPSTAVARLEPTVKKVSVLHPFGRQEDIFADVMRVYTKSAPLALVAVLRGIPTTVLGGPFYAGWGLTDDRAPIKGRTKQLSRQRLFTAAVLLYPRYFPGGKGFGLPPEFHVMPG